MFLNFTCTYLEFLDEQQMKACIEYSHLDMPAKPTLFMEFHGATDDEVSTQAKTAGNLLTGF
jgi:D-lactate dehydrogenase (cytochrome)